MRTALVFFYSRTCGVSRRMDSVVDHFLRSHRSQLRVAKVDIDERADLAAKFGVGKAPALLLLDGVEEVARIEGRSTLPRMVDTFGPLIATPPADATPHGAIVAAATASGGAGRTESSRAMAGAS